MKKQTVRILVVSLFLFIPVVDSAAQQDLTDIWYDNGGSKYLIRQVGNDIFWMVDARPRVINVFHGTISGNTITGYWADLPEGQIQGDGKLVLRIEDSDTMVKVSGSYGASTWTRNCSVVYRMELVSCHPDICGGYAQNRGVFTPADGKAYVTVCQTGEMLFSIPALVDRQTGQRIGRKSFEIHYGVFGDQQWTGGKIGGITTDNDGSFEGKSGIKVSLPVSKSIVLNSDGASQFISMPPYYTQPAYPDKQP